MSSVRSLHQVSIYDYPEHLNPFYDDDQHRRLRFWRIGSNKKQGGSRRGSFNLGSLKDLLPSSLRKKKTSSTLGINKTSESPPQMRRVMDGYESDVPQFATFDRRFDPASEGAFERSARYRNSLQNMHNSSLGNRNEPFRSTMQYGNRPTPAKNSRYGGFCNNAGSTSTTPRGYYLTPGSSMNSISTNPFDDDDDGDSVNIRDHSSPPSGNKRLRKKRQAPLPPAPAPLNYNETHVGEEVELRINEDVEALKGLEELTRMTAEFQSFVARSDDAIDKKPESDDAIRNYSEIVETVEVHDKLVNVNKSREANVEQSQTVVESTTRNVRIDEIEVQEPSLKSLKINESATSRSREETPDYIPMTVREKFHVLRIHEPELNEKAEKAATADDAQKEDEAESSVAITPSEVYNQPLNEEIVLESVVTVKESSLSSQSCQSSQYSREREASSDTTSYLEPNNHLTYNVEKAETRRLSSEINAAESSKGVQQEEISAQASASPEPMRKLSQPNIKEAKQAEVEEKLSSQGFVRVHEPIRFYEDIETFIRRKHPQSDEENCNPDDPPKPPQRRRSVKDVIESINRNQQLLKCATPKFDKRYDNLTQKFSYHEKTVKPEISAKPAVPSKQMALFKLQQQAESEKKINALLADLQDFDNQNQTIERTKKFPYDINNNARSSSATFDKCNLRRDSNNNNNVTEDDSSVRISRSEINPVPKPRRLLE